MNNKNTTAALEDLTLEAQLEAVRAEREQARELAANLFARFSRPGLVTTTAEEVSWFLEQAEAVGATVEPSEELVEAAIVGDPVGFLTIR